MKKLWILIVILLGLIILNGCIQKSPAEDILDRMLKNYKSMDTYKITEATEIRSTYEESITPKNIGGEKPEKITQEKTRIRETKRDIIYKKPDKLKTIEEGGIIIITDKSYELKYNPKFNTICKESSKVLFFQSTNYMDIFIKNFLELYNLEYLGIEQVEDRDFYSIKLIPKQKLDYYEGGELYTMKILITKDYLLKQIDSYKNGELKISYKYINYEINNNIPDNEFELPRNAKILPQKLEFSNIAEAQNEFGGIIKVPTYLPKGIELSFVEVVKLCNREKYVILNYKKEGEIVLTITEINSSRREVIIGNDEEICYNLGVDYLIDTKLNMGELNDILEPFECWTMGRFIHSQ